jgi:photosystem II stability/assembly factor-like uncharacterized protein
MRQINLAGFFVMLCLLLVVSSCNKDKITLVTRQVDGHNNYELHKVIFIGDSIGYIVGGSRYGIGMLIKSTDGGNTWTQPDSVGPKCFYGCCFLNAAQGYAAGYDSWWAATTDSAKTFAVTVGDYHPINGISFLNSSRGVRVGGDGYASGVIASTFDGGNTWGSTSYTSNMRDVQFIDSNTVVVSGYGLILKSTDGGLTFNATSAFGDFFVSMDFPTSSTGYFAGYQGEIIKTTDAANSFHRVKAGNGPFKMQTHFEAIKFWDENTGYVVGDAGVMYQTTDGGGKWEEVKAFTANNLRGIHLFSATSGIVIGDNGSIFLFKQ